ncbi:MAG: hypothetical protein ACQXXG_09900 [Candidatus Bathyarchaeia archaeon]|jgi:hypothetical protein
MNEIKNEKEKVFEFEFNKTWDPDKGIPYVAKLGIDNEGKITREFCPMKRTWGHKSVTVEGQFTARVGDIVEQRHGGSRKYDYRYWFIVTPGGELKKVAAIWDSEDKARVVNYLKGKISLEELVARTSHYK